MADLLVTQILSALTILAIKLLSGFCPMFITSRLLLKRKINDGKNNKKDDLEAIGRGVSTTSRFDRIWKVVSELALSFGSGVMLATIFVHLTPEVREMFRDLDSSYQWVHQNDDIPFPEIFICVGFLLIFAIETLTESLCNISTSQEDTSVIHIDGVDRNRLTTPSPPTPYHPTHEITCDGRCHGHDPSSLNSLETKEWNLSCVTRKSRENGSKKACEATHSDEKHYDYQVESNKRPIVIPDSLTLSISHHLSDASGGESDFTGSTRLTSTPPSQQSRRRHPLLDFLRLSVFIVALSVHGIFEGMAVGLQGEDSNIWILVFAISVHSIPIMFCAGLDVAEKQRSSAASNTTTTTDRDVSSDSPSSSTDESSNSYNRFETIVLLTSITVAAVSTPIGILTGSILNYLYSDDTVPGESGGSNELFLSITLAIATGSLLYILIFEMFVKTHQQKMTSSSFSLFRFISVLSGFIVILVVVTSLGDHDHSSSSSNGKHDLNYGGDEGERINDFLSDLAHLHHNDDHGLSEKGNHHNHDH